MPGVQPLDNEIRIEYHPASDKEAQHFIFEDYIDNFIQADPHLNNVPDPRTKGPEPVWHPFSSRLDFEIAELIQDTHMNSRQTDALLSLIRQCIDQPESYTLKNSKDLKEIWTAARAKTIAVRVLNNYVCACALKEFCSLKRKPSVYLILERIQPLKKSLKYGVGHFGTGAPRFCRIPHSQINSGGMQSVFSSTVTNMKNLSAA